MRTGMDLLKFGISYSVNTCIPLRTAQRSAATQRAARVQAFRRQGGRARTQAGRATLAARRARAQAIRAARRRAILNAETAATRTAVETQTITETGEATAADIAGAETTGLTRRTVQRTSRIQDFPTETQSAFDASQTLNTGAEIAANSEFTVVPVNLDQTAGTGTNNRQVLAIVPVQNNAQPSDFVNFARSLPREVLQQTGQTV